MEKGSSPMGAATGQSVFGDEGNRTQDIVKKRGEYNGQKVGRNDPCPCGSGKKFKKCHGQ
jgi:preprotein translocase subunit SecA